MTKTLHEMDMEERKARSERVTQKSQLLATVRNQLHEANEAFEAGNDKAVTAEKLAEIPARTLYLMEVDKTISRAEINAILIEEFGAKVRPSDGKESKTPAGKGEDIRKRIVRAVQTATFLADGGEAPTFLNGADVDKAASIMAAVDEGTYSIWSAYDELGALKTKTAAVDPAFNLSLLGKIVASLTSEGATDVLRQNKALRMAYLDIIEAYQDLDLTAAPSEEKPEEKPEQGAGQVIQGPTPNRQTQSRKVRRAA